ncbi:MAG: T9SS type A sorting domain-containing protein [Flavobacteriales bacterium]|nr:T9SS type A sorting domain-containing protein [Flavobacteriales bacterium]
MESAGGDFWEYDTALGTWQQKAAFGGPPRGEAVGFSIGSKGYIGTGHGNGQNVFFADFWEYDPATNNWTQKADFGGGVRSDAIGFSIGSKGYIGTGKSTDNNSSAFWGHSNDFWEYDPTTDTWTQKATVGGGGRSGAVGFSIGSKGYLGTGYDGFNSRDDFWEYDPLSNGWVPKANVPGGSRLQATGFSIGPNGYVGLGDFEELYVPRSGHSDFWEYRPGTNSWVPATEFSSSAEVYALGLSVANRGYVFGGRPFSNPQSQNEVWEYDPNSTNTWTQKTNFGGTARSAAAAFSIGTKGYICSGNDGFIIDHPLKDLWQFDQETGSWSQKADLDGQARMWAVGFAIGNKGYISTGCDEGVTNHALSDLWEYDPATNAWTEKTSMPGEPRQKATAFAIGSNAYITMGVSTVTGGDMGDLLVYHQATDTWTFLNPCPGGARRYAVGFSIGNKGYIGAGSSFSGVLETDLDHTTSFADFWEFDPATEQWTPRADVGAIFEKGVAFSIGDKGYVGTGGYGFLAHDDFKEYDPVADTWTPKQVYGGGPRGAAVGFAIGAKGYIGTGYDEFGSRSNSFWEWDSGLLCIPGGACSDGDPCTDGDALNANCACVGITIPGSDSDGDGVCDARDLCPGFPDNQDADGDGHPDGCDSCPLLAGLEGGPCDDNNPCTIGEFITSCVCGGGTSLPDSDGDGICDLYDTDWTILDPFSGGGRVGMLAFTINGFGYVGTGYNGTYHNDMWQFDPGNESWTQVQDMPGPGRQYAMAFSIGNMGYAGTGRIADGPLFTSASLTNDFQAYDPIANQWHAVATWPGNYIVGGVAFAVAGYGYAGGGISTQDNGIQWGFWQFDPTTENWIYDISFNPVNSPSIGLAYASSFTVGNKAYVAMGSLPGSGSAYGANLFQFDPTTPVHWNQKATCPGAGRTGAGAFAIGQAGYICGGTNPNTFLNDTWEYNTSLDQWAQRANYSPIGRFGAASFAIGASGYLVGGLTAYTTSGGVFLDEVLRYTPNQMLDCNGILNGPATPGAPCNNGDPCTTGGTIIDCLCVGASPLPDNDGDGTCDQFDNDWKPKSGFGVGRADAVSFSIGDFGYVGTGENASGYLNDLWQFDAVNNTWSQMANVPGGGRTGAVAFTIGDFGYVTTGYGGGTSFLVDLQRYDPSNNTWSPMADFGNGEAHIARGFGVGFAVVGKGYVGLGYGEYVSTSEDGTAYKHDIWSYDPVLDQWAFDSEFLPGNRIGAIAFAINGKGYVGMGSGFPYPFGTQGPQKDLFELDPATHWWTPKADMPASADQRTEAVGFAIGSKGYVGTGGGFSNTNETDFWRYDPATDMWARQTDFLGGARQKAIAFAIGDSGYVGTGFNEGNYMDDLYRYFPNATCEPGMPCDDGDACTIDEVWDASCVCSGGAPNLVDLDNDLYIDCMEQCPGTPFGEFVNTDGCSCSQLTIDDGDPCTQDDCTNGIVTHTPLDSDNDGISDCTDSCPYLFGENGDVCGGGSCLSPGTIIGCVCTSVPINQPAGDAYSTAIPIILNSGSATVNGNNMPCYTSTYSGTNAQASPDVFYSISTGSCASGTMTLSTCAAGTLSDTYLHVLNAAGTNQLAFNDDSPCAFGNLRSALTLPVTANTTYIVVVEGYGNSAPGTFSLSVSVPQTVADSDGDGTRDCEDGCPNDPNKTAPGLCGCGVAEGSCSADCLGVVGGSAVPGSGCDDGEACTINDVYSATCVCAGTIQDTDLDGTCDAQDGCPNDPNKIVPGICGCGNVDHANGSACSDGNACTLNDTYLNCVCVSGTPSPDSDGDGACDATDGCPYDPNKIAPGTCGCGNVDHTDGEWCSDGNACNGLEVYLNCICVAGTPLNCDDGDPCTIDSCNPLFGCVHDPAPDSDGDGLCDAVDSCPGIPGQVGGPCDDNNPCTNNDMLNAQCACVGSALPDSDGDGICDSMDNCPTAPGQLGSSCDDGTPCTINDVLGFGCICSGTYQDTDGDGTCDATDGCPNDPNKIAPGNCGCGNPEPGTSCNDNNPNTTNDLIGSNCVCAGTPIGGCTNDLQLVFQTDGISTVGWELRELGTNTPVQSGGGPYPASQDYTLPVCLPDGCFYLVVTDDANDGFIGGGYFLRVLNGPRLIDNRNNFTTGSSSSIGPLQGFCLPMGNDRLITQSCDRMDLRRGANAPCSDRLTADDTPNGTTGNVYQFWFFDPNGGLNLFYPPNGPGPNQVSMASLPSLVAGTMYNVKVRTQISPGTWREWGPACRMRIDNTLGQCGAAGLINDPSNANHSCGKNITLPAGTSSTAANRVVCMPVTRYNNNCVNVQANKYQFRFRLPSENVVIVRNSTNNLTHLFTSSGFQRCRTYQVEVRASFDNGLTWCRGGTDPINDLTPWGDVCEVYTGGCANGGNQNLLGEGGSGPNDGLRMYPNPNRGDQLMLSLENITDGVHTVSVDIYDVFGKRVTARTIPVADGFINTVLELNGDLANGMYFVNITAGDETWTERLVIQP